MAESKIIDMTGRPIEAENTVTDSESEIAALLGIPAGKLTDHPEALKSMDLFTTAKMLELYAANLIRQSSPDADVAGVCNYLSDAIGRLGSFDLEILKQHVYTALNDVMEHAAFVAARVEFMQAWAKDQERQAQAADNQSADPQPDTQVDDAEEDQQHVD